MSFQFRKLPQARRIIYLMQDEFVAPRLAGAINGTNAEPGPGVRTVVDSNNLMTISGGQLLKTGTGPGAHDPVCQYQAGVTRVPGQLTCGRMAGFANLDAAFWGLSATLNQRPTVLAFYFTASNLQVYYNSSQVIVGTYTLTGEYSLVVAMRAGGGFFFIKGVEYLYFTLMGWCTAGTQATLYPGYGGHTGTYKSDYISVPQPLWLPSPILSDGFSSVASDGLGHAEGAVAEGPGHGGMSMAWVDAVGTWQIAAGVASASALAGGIAIRACNVGNADSIFEVALTRAGGNVGIVLRYIDSSNYLYAYHDGTNATLRQVVAGVDSELIAPTAAAYAAGRILRISVSGLTARMYYNLVAIGVAVTMDAALQDATSVGLYTTNVGNTFDNALCFAVGTAGEYG